MGALGGAGRGGNFFPEDGIFFVEDDFSATENGIFFVEDVFSATEDGIFFAEDSASGRKNGAAESPMGGAEPGDEPFTPEGWLMAQWNSRATWSSGVLWGP